MAEIGLTAGALIVHVEGMDKLWALKSRLEVPLDHVAGAAVAGEAAPPLLSLRAPGTHVPGVIAAGTFYYEGKRVFWNVHDPSKAVLIRLHDEIYDELVVEVEDPDKTVAGIEEAIGTREDR